MCHWRRVSNYYRKCGHSIPLPDEHIHCTNYRCKFSPNHPIDCLPPMCHRTCWQYRQYPQSYMPHLDSYCPSCMARMNAKLGYYH